MLSLALPVDIYLCVGPTDMRKSFNGLWAFLPDPATLPDDPAVLKALVVQLLEELQKAHAKLQRQEHHMHLLLKKIYGRTSEKLDPRQGLLFNPELSEEEEASNTPASDTSEDTPASSSRTKNRDRHGPGLMSQVIVSKAADHLPLYRLESIFKRQGVRISRQTMDGWWLKTAEFLQPLYMLAAQVVLASHVIHTDDTPVKVRDAHRKQKHTGRFWPYVGDPRHPLTVFDYTPTHQRDGPAAFLADYRGYLQADAFSGYDGLYLESNGRIIEVACWAHARRKFHESRRLDSARMETALAWIGKLYAVEKDLRKRCQGEWENLALDERAERIAAERQQRSRPLLDDFHAWLEAEAPKVLPKSPVRGAIDYTLNNWAALTVYPDDGWLDIDNNEGENSLRGLCIGRRNWLFCGSDRGGRAAAIRFSLIASCKRHAHDPWVYYRDLLTRLPATPPNASEEELLKLLPHLWKPA